MSQDMKDQAELEEKWVHGKEKVGEEMNIAKRLRRGKQKSCA